MTTLDDDFARHFSALTTYDVLLLAVSGGADSLALLYLVADWRQSHAPGTRLEVATVDHGLRAGSDAEVRDVAAAAADLGLRHHALLWTSNGVETGIQDHARTARYRLLAALASQFDGKIAIVTAHHRDDQAETILMRLARGSGLDGLAAMAPRRALAGCGRIAIERPLLGVPKARLVAYLTDRGIPWVDDPSNSDRRFERARLRAHATALSAAGLSSAALARSARRLRRARSALETWVDEVVAAAVDLHGGAYASVSAATVTALPDEIRVRLLLRLARYFGGQATEPPLATAERLAGLMSDPAFRGGSIGGITMMLRNGDFHVYREQRSGMVAQLRLEREDAQVWDNRFLVRAARTKLPIDVRPLGMNGLRALGANQAHVPSVPHRALLTLPSFWAGSELVAAPYLNWNGSCTGDDRQEPSEACTASFLFPEVAVTLGDLTGSWPH